MANVKLPYVIWRDGRPRFNPSAREIALGFATEDLRHGSAGPWFTLDEARTWALARHQEIREARAAGRRRAMPVTRRGGTVGDLLDDWLTALRADTDADTRLSPDTIRSYEKAAAAVRWKPETRSARKARLTRARAVAVLERDAVDERRPEPFAQVAAAAVDKIALNDFFLYLKKARGTHMAHAAIAAFSAAHTWGSLDRRWRLGANPRHGLNLPRPEGRIVIYSDAEIRALLAAADALGRPSIGDAVMLGLFTCQRQRDRVYLKDDGLNDGRRHFRQSKTGKLIPVREAPQLAARLALARKRVAEMMLAHGVKEQARPDTIVVDETTVATYRQDTYRHVFAQVRALAIAGSSAHGLAPCPSLAGKRDQDLRDTSVTWLARAGNTLMEICAISGHSPKSVQTIIEHYLGSHAELADSGIDKLVAWMAREGIAV